MIFGSVCSGIEAASCAWHPLGWQTAFVSEIEPFPCSVLKQHYPEVPNHGDMTKFKEWPDARINVLVGGLLMHGLKHDGSPAPRERQDQGEEMKMSQAEVDKALAEYPRVKPAPAKPVENWYYLDEVLTLHQLGKWQGFDAAYTEMKRVSAERGTPYLILICEDQAKDWRAQLDRWLGNDGYTQKYKKRKGDL